METKNNSTVDEKQKKVGKDDEFISTVYRLLSMNQTGSVVNGHYMQIDGSNVKCDAASSSPAAEIKIRSVADDSLNELWVLESKTESGKVVAIENSQVVVKDSPVAQYTSLHHVQSVAPEILFYKMAKSSGSEFSYFKHFHTGSILGFDSSGSAMNPGDVVAKTLESLFSIID